MDAWDELMFSFDKLKASYLSMTLGLRIHVLLFVVPQKNTATSPIRGQNKYMKILNTSQLSCSGDEICSEQIHRSWHLSNIRHTSSASATGVPYFHSKYFNKDRTQHA